MGKLTDPMFGNVPPDDTVTLVFNLSQRRIRGPGEEPEFEYIADPQPRWHAASAGEPRRRTFS
jgi:Mn-containing catalase